MNRKIRYIIAAWVVVCLAILIEHFYVYNHTTLKNVREYARNAGNIFDEVDQKVDDLTGSGQMNYLLWSQGRIADELKLVKAMHPSIQDVLIFNEEFHLLGATSDKFSPGEIVPLLEKTRHARIRTSAVTSDGYLHVYPAVADDKAIDGYVALVLNPPPLINQARGKGTGFVMNVTRGNLHFNNPGFVNNDEALGIKEKLRAIEMDESGCLNEAGAAFEIFWSYYPPRNVYFGYVRQARPFYGYVSFYAGFMCLLVSLAAIASIFSGRSRKYEVYEKIIENNMRTLAEMKKGIDLFISDAGGGKILEMEKTVIDVPLYEPGLSSREAVPAYYHKPEKTGDEVLISDFILLDPLNIKWYKPLKRKSPETNIEKASRLSREAFTPELMNLMDQVSKKTPAQVSSTEGPFVEEAAPPQRDRTVAPWRSVEKDAFAGALEMLYADDEPGEALDIVLENIRVAGKADALAVLFFDRNIGCFTIETSAGLDVSWSRHFYLLSTDSVLSCPVDRTNNIPVSEELMKNSFFKKRIPPQHLTRLGAIKLMTIQHNDIPLRVALFYWKDGSFYAGNKDSLGTSLERIDTPAYARMFTEILPVLNRIYLERERANIRPEESYRDIYNILKSFTALSDRRVHIVHVQLSVNFEENFRILLREKCRDGFKNYERYIVNNPRHLIFLLNVTSPEFVEKIIGEVDPAAQVKVMQYPDLGKNLFAYL